MNEVAVKTGKLLALAFDRAATEPEAVAAFVSVRRIIINDGRNWRELVSNESIRSKSSMVFPFGKHKGETVEDVIDVDREYLEWFVKNIRGCTQLVNLIRAMLSRSRPSP